MEYRRLGRSGLKISPLCLGTMMFGAQTDEATAQRIIARARDQGVNFIDTADAYAEGRSEEIVGRAIKSRRDDWIVATKLGNPIGTRPGDPLASMDDARRRSKPAAPRHRVHRRLLFP